MAEYRASMPSRRQLQCVQKGRKGILFWGGTYRFAAVQPRKDGINKTDGRLLSGYKAERAEPGQGLFADQ